jgi:predicted DCC family thiol-disulfide oxidoreductase YuxK
MSAYTPIVFYDGVCGVCNKFVQFILKHDRDKKIYFCALQTDTAKRILISYKAFEGVDELNTVYFIDEDFNLYKRSNALIKIFETLRGKVFLLTLLKICPSFLLDLGYNLFAKYRFWFGKNQCVIITNNDKERFI